MGIEPNNSSTVNLVSKLQHINFLLICFCIHLKKLLYINLKKQAGILSTGEIVMDLALVE